MATASVRLRRIVLVLSTAIGAYLLSPVGRIVPLVGIAAADDGGLGGSAALGALNFTFVVSLILTFIFGFAIRDVVHRYAMRAKAKKQSVPAPKRA